MSTAVKDHSPGFLAIVHEAKKRIREIDIGEYQRLRDSGQAGQLVDVREDNEWDEAHAAGAMHLSKGIIERDIEATFPEKDVKLVLYCGGGYRSALATDNLQKMGYTNVESMDGGWKGWVDAGLPTEK